MNREMMYECLADECKVPGCQNQRFRRRQYAQLEVFPTPGKGFGLRCATDLEAGDFVVEYCGEILDAGEFRRRTEQYDKEGDEHWYFMQIDDDNTVDASRMSNLARFMNHCCEPNCMTQKWAVDGEVAVGFFTTEFVPAGTELTFDYNFKRYSDKTIECKCGAPSCSGFIGGDADAKTLALASESEEEMGGDDEDNISPTSKKPKKAVKRDLLGKAITKKKEEKAWAPGMAEGWSSEDESEEDMSEGEDEGRPAGGKKRKASTGGARAKKQKRSSSGGGGRSKSDSKAEARKRFKEAHPDATAFDLELWEMCDRRGGVSNAASVGKICALITQKRVSGDKDACEKLLKALALTTHDSARSHFITKVDGLQVLNATIKKFVLGGSGVDVPLAQVVMKVLDTMNMMIMSNVATFRTNCKIGETLSDVAAAAKEAGHAELSGASGKWAQQINEKVQKYGAIHSVTIEKSRTSLGGAGDIAERKVSRGALGTVFIGNIPAGWKRRNMRDWLGSPAVQMGPRQILAIEVLGQYKEGQQCMVECESSSAADALVENVMRLASEQRSAKYEAKRLNLSDAEKAAKEAEERAAAEFRQQPRLSSGGGSGSGVCFAFQSGNCDRGDDCRFSHAAESSPRDRDSGNGGGSGWGASSMLSPKEPPAPAVPSAPKVEPKAVSVEDGYTVFRRDLSAVVAKQLSKYHRDKKIADKDSFKYLARKITHTIMEKEMKHSSQNLKVNDDTKRKVAKFIKEYFKKLPTGVYKINDEQKKILNKKK